MKNFIVTVVAALLCLGSNDNNMSIFIVVIAAAMLCIGVKAQNNWSPSTQPCVSESEIIDYGAEAREYCRDLMGIDQEELNNAVNGTHADHQRVGCYVCCFIQYFDLFLLDGTVHTDKIMDLIPWYVHDFQLEATRVCSEAILPVQYQCDYCWRSYECERTIHPQTYDLKGVIRPPILNC